jgi:kynureninase
VLSAALNMAREDAPQRKTLVSERSNFPTDLYIAEALCRERGCTLKLVEPEEIAASLTADVAVLMLTHVNYRTGAMHDMAAVTRPRRTPPASSPSGISRTVPVPCPWT